MLYQEAELSLGINFVSNCHPGFLVRIYICHCGKRMIEMKKNKEEEKEIKSNGCQQEGTEQGRTE